MSLAKFSVGQPILVNLIGLSVAISGAFVWAGMTREAYPTVANEWCEIATIFPGASPEEVDQLVTTPIEDAVASIDGIVRISGESREGVSEIFLRFDPSVDVDRELMRVTNHVNRVTDLPEGAERPVVSGGTRDMPALRVAVVGDVPDASQREVVERLRRKLARVPGVSDVSVQGLARRQIHIEVDPGALSTHGITLGRVREAVVSRANNVPAGVITTPRNASLVRGMLQTATPRQVEGIVVRPDASGGAVRIKDIARVSAAVGTDGQQTRIDGLPAVALVVLKGPSGDTIDISQAVRDLVRAEASHLPSGLQLRVFGDAAPEIRRTLGTLNANAVAGFFLVAGVMWLSVGFRNALMALLGLPVAIAGGILMMHALGITLNLLSMASLILCLGIMVDDAIVVIENIFRRIEEGEPPKQAAILGAQEVLWPVIASTMTTIAAFLPLLIMTGVMGKFLSIIPKVVIAALLASLLEALVILPGHMADFGKPKKGAKRRLTARFATLGNRLLEGYVRWLRGALRFPLWVVIGSYLICGALIAAAVATKDVILFSEGDVNAFEVRVMLPRDASRTQTDLTLREIEQRLGAIRTADVTTVRTILGQTNTDLWSEYGDHAGMVTVYLRPPEERDAADAGHQLLQRARAALRTVVGPSQLQVVEDQMRPPVGAPVAVQIAGPDRERIESLSQVVMEDLRSIDGVTEVGTDSGTGKLEIRVHVDDDKAAMHMLTGSMVGQFLREALSSFPVAVARSNGEEVDLVVRIRESARNDARRLRELTMDAIDGTPVALGDVATFEEARSPYFVRRLNREPTVVVRGYIDNTKTTSQAANRELARVIAPIIAANADVNFSLGGEWEETDESLRSLMAAFLIAALLIYTILAAQFRSLLQPAIVMTAIPLGLIGVVVGFFATGAPIGLVALVGVVGLTGIVVNDALLLVDFANRRQRQGVPALEAVVDAARLRVRPILLTSVTTIVGLLPLSLAGAAAPLLAPMATAIVFGLLFATAMVLFVIPSLYVVVAVIRSRMRPTTKVG